MQDRMASLRRRRGGAPRVGLALGVGSAAAMAEIGAVEVLRESGVPIHCVAGSSAGAVVGAAYASGRISELRECLAGLSRRGVMRLFDLAWPREGLLHGCRALDLMLQIAPSEVGMFDLHRTGELALLGRRVAEQALPEIREALGRFAVSDPPDTAPTRRREAS
jgi:predicted acylesterase/phospholipase RssA